MKYRITSGVTGGTFGRPYLRAQNGEAAVNRFKIIRVILFN
jgi:hypothetical protein